MNRRIAPLPAFGIAALAALNVCLVAIALQQVDPADPAPGAAPQWDFKITVAADGVPARPIGNYEQTLAHPVFFRTREPFVAPPPPPQPLMMRPPAPPPPPPADPGLTLSGILIGEDVRKAYVTSRTDPRGCWVSEGDDIAGWNVKSVAPSAIIIEQQNRTIEVLLYPQR